MDCFTCITYGSYVLFCHLTSCHRCCQNVFVNKFTSSLLFPMIPTPVLEEALELQVVPFPSTLLSLRKPTRWPLDKIHAFDVPTKSSGLTPIVIVIFYSMAMTSLHMHTQGSMLAIIFPTWWLFSGVWWVGNDNSKNFPTYPWNIPPEPEINSSCRNSFHFGEGYAPEVCWGFLKEQSLGLAISEKSRTRIGSTS